MKKFLTAAAIGAVLALGLTACGSTAGGNGSGSTTGSSDVPQSIVDMVKTAGAPQKWSGPTTSPAVAKNINVVSIPCSMAAVGCARWDAGVHAAAKVLGWNVQTIDPAFDPTKTNQAFQQAINSGAKAIVMISIDPSLVANSIAQARKAGIVVVSAGAGYEDGPFTDTGIQADLSQHGNLEGQWTGAAACDTLGGKGKVLTLLDTQFKLVEQRIDGAKTSLAKCKGITNEVKQVSAADLGTVLQSKVAAMIQSDPDIKAIISPADAYATDILVALQQTGKANSIDVFSMDGNQNIVQAIADGGAMKATVGGSLEQLGWATLDNVNRLLNNDKADSVNSGFQTRLITKDFIPTNDTYTGDVDYAKIYTQLWTTGKYSG